VEQVEVVEEEVIHQMVEVECHQEVVEGVIHQMEEAGYRQVVGEEAIRQMEEVECHQEVVGEVIHQMGEEAGTFHQQWEGNPPCQEEVEEAFLMGLWVE
jgi:hypothetical protein